MKPDEFRASGRSVEPAPSQRAKLAMTVYMFGLLLLMSLVHSWLVFGGVVIAATVGGFVFSKWQSSRRG